jgi:branched-chain amino acid transport system ATP-binding protein
MSELVLDRPLRPLLELVDVRLDRQAGRGAAGHPLGPIGCGFDEATITGLIGLSGAGREAMLELIAGCVAPAAGSVRFGGLRIDHHSPSARARLGIGIVRRQRLVPNCTLQTMLGLARAVVSRPAWRLVLGIATGPDASDRADIAAILDFLDISHLAERPVASFGGLEARLAELARCLIQRPRLLLLERPLAGLVTEDRTTLARCLARLRRADLTMVVMEDDLATVGRLADRCLVLERGRLVADASPDVIGASSRVFHLLTGSTL